MMRYHLSVAVFITIIMASLALYVHLVTISLDDWLSLTILCLIHCAIKFKFNTYIVHNNKAAQNAFSPISTHLSDVRISVMASQIKGFEIVCSTVCSGACQRKHQSSASQAFVSRIRQWPVDFPNKGLVTRKMRPLDEVIMNKTQHYDYIFTIIHYQFNSNLVITQLKSFTQNVDFNCQHYL